MDRTGTNPPLCYMHQKKSAGHSFANMRPLGPFDPKAKLERIARNDRHPQQLQALKMMLDDGSCPVCAARRETDPDLDFEKMTVDQQDRMLVLLDAFEDLTREINSPGTAERTEPSKTTFAKIRENEELVKAGLPALAPRPSSYVPPAAAPPVSREAVLGVAQEVSSVIPEDKRAAIDAFIQSLRDRGFSLDEIEFMIRKAQADGLL